MKVLQILLICVIVGILSLWVYGFNQANDFEVESFNIAKQLNIKKVLLLFPHPDDEAQAMGGTISQFVQNNIQVDWVIFTKGERGTEDAHIDVNLKDIRVKEAQVVAKILNVSSLLIKDYPDNGMDEQSKNLSKDIENIIKDKKPDLIVTYDMSGGYGHPDHIIVSKITTQLLQNNFPHIKLWYTSTPHKLMSKLTLPEQLARDTEFTKARTTPNRKVWVGIPGLFNKIQSVYAYKSQRKSFMKSVPYQQIPLWFYVSLTPFEYFYTVN